MMPRPGGPPMGMGPPPVRIRIYLNGAQSHAPPPHLPPFGSRAQNCSPRSITGHAAWVSARWSASEHGGAARHASSGRPPRHGQRHGHGHGGTTRGHAAAGGPTAGKDLPRPTSMNSPYRRLPKLLSLSHGKSCRSLSLSLSCGWLTLSRPRAIATSAISRSILGNAAWVSAWVSAWWSTPGHGGAAGHAPAGRAAQGYGHGHGHGHGHGGTTRGSTPWYATRVSPGRTTAGYGHAATRRPARDAAAARVSGTAKVLRQNDKGTSGVQCLVSVNRERVLCGVHFHFQRGMFISYAPLSDFRRAQAFRQFAA